MTFHSRSGFPSTAGVLAEFSRNEIFRVSRPGAASPTRAQERRRDRSIAGEPGSFRDPDGEAGRGRFGDAY